MIEIEAGLLKAAVQEVAAVVDKRSSVLVLQNILIDAERGKVVLRGTDLDNYLDRHVDVVSAKKLRTTVSARVLAGVVKQLPGDAIATLKMDGERLEVSAGRARFSLATIDPEGFPGAGEAEWLAQFEVSAVELRMMIDRVRFAVSTEETRYYLNGIFMHRWEEEGQPPVLHCAATDGHRLARYTLPLPSGGETLPDAIVPRRAIELLRKMINKLEGAVDIAFSANKVRFDFGQTTITAKLIDGTFPDYKRVIPSANDKRLTIEAAPLAEAIGRIQTVSTDKTRGVELALGKDLATLTVKSAENGHAIEEVGCDYAAEDLRIGFNTRYLLDVLACMPGAEIELDLADPAAPTVLRNPNDERSLYVLMPMRV